MVERTPVPSRSSRGSDRPLKVVHLLYRLRLGGMESGVVRIANGLCDRGIITEVCSCQPADALNERLRADVKLVEFSRRDGNDAGFVVNLARYLRRATPDVVHTHSWGTLCEGFVAARLAGVPHIIHGEHGTMETRPRNLHIQRVAWHRMDAVLAVSAGLAERMAKTVRYPMERIRVIHNGVDTERFTPLRRERARDRLGVSPRELLVGTVGRLVPVKDQARLLGALAAVRDRGIQCRALIVGDGPLREELQAQARALGLGDQVSFLGERHDVEDLHSALDLFVLSSVSEGLSNTILEAMASGVAVIATRVGGANEMVRDGHSGLLVNPSDTGALAEGIRSLLESDERRRSMGGAGRRTADEEFSIPRMLDQYAQLYCNTVDASRVASACVA